ncbi:MAG: metal-dependent hydrolase [Polyangiaceae bacterium]|nr:metal-dependent hydrolase [Polyangiaceae bacterium]
MEIRPFPIDRLGKSVPRHWLAQSVLATHLANGVSVLFPAGERFFVRSVKHFAEVYRDDPALAEAVRKFAGQEGWHAGAHDRHIQMLEDQGYRIRPFLEVYERFCYSFLERVFSPKLRLAATAAAEHFTAIMAENFLDEGFERGIDPVMLDLLRWHAAEEIEHRSVAFDVLKRVDDRYSLRMAGLALSGSVLAAFWIAGALTLLAQEKGLARAVRREGKEVAQRMPFGERVFGRGIRSYLRRDFHPNDASHLDAIAEEVLAAFAPRKPEPQPAA